MNTTEQKFYALLTSIEDKLNTLIELQKPKKEPAKKTTKKPVKRKKT
jgi:hypothetical protein|tara:strand:- start:446 stop:586 length:141 start_codon:yes stop_codon:yes gene_type:complete